MDHEVIIIGGGLAGILSGLKLKELGFDPLIIDASLPQAEGSIGGFMKFSGAKFSLPPAGLGLLDVAGGRAELFEAISEVERLLNLDFSYLADSVDFNEELSSLRKYSSHMLSKQEVSDLTDYLSELLSLRGVSLLKGRCSNVELVGELFEVTVDVEGKRLAKKANAIFYAGGRSDSSILKAIGVEANDGKGLDVGVRVEFLDYRDLSPLRRFGPDAKILRKACRTFCLNVPGEIYYYEYNGVAIPGGIVADEGEEKANFGILYRLNNKVDFLNRVISRYKDDFLAPVKDGFTVENGFLGEAEPYLKYLYGEAAVQELKEFAEFLAYEGLVDWSKKHIVHLPLLDWHWDTYAVTGSFKTSVKDVYCLGDISGHARGLLQAAVSGILAAREYIDERS